MFLPLLCIAFPRPPAGKDRALCKARRNSGTRSGKTAQRLLYKKISPLSRGNRAETGRTLTFYSLFTVARRHKKGRGRWPRSNCLGQIICLPALAVWTRLKPARNGRWVASSALICFQHPTILKGGREACRPHRELSVPFKKCGFKRAHHAPSRKNMWCFVYCSSSSSKKRSINRL